MKKFLLALVLGVGMLVPLAIPAAAEAHPYPARAYRYHHDHYGYWHDGYRHNYHHR